MKLRDLRKAKRLTQAELASRAGGYTALHWGFGTRRKEKSERSRRKGIG